MAKYFLDFEFIEGFHKSLFGKRRHFIDMISVGIKCEDGREYYAISNEFDPKVANEWVCANVLIPIIDSYIESCNGDKRNMVLSCLGNKSVYKQIRIIQKWIGKSNKQIADDIICFCTPELYNSDKSWTGALTQKDAPEFYGFYSDYDWVLFCSLFGTMMDLPTGFPMYCIDLKQTLDEVLEEMHFERPSITKEECLNELKSLNFKNPILAYPKQTGEHNALEDAKWNYELYKFLQTIK